MLHRVQHDKFVFSDCHSEHSEESSARGIIDKQGEEDASLRSA
jgi:hypothetical protein